MRRSNLSPGHFTWIHKYVMWSILKIAKADRKRFPKMRAAIILGLQNYCKSQLSNFYESPKVAGNIVHAIEQDWDSGEEIKEIKRPLDFLILDFHRHSYKEFLREDNGRNDYKRLASFLRQHYPAFAKFEARSKAPRRFAMVVFSKGHFQIVPAYEKPS